MVMDADGKMMSCAMIIPTKRSLLTLDGQSASCEDILCSMFYSYVFGCQWEQDEFILGGKKKKRKKKKSLEFTFSCSDE